MPVPDYQTLMAPALSVLADGIPRARRTIPDLVADSLRISFEDRALRVKSGSPVFHVRVYWALTYMSQAGLVERPTRGILQITDRGRKILRECPQRIDDKVLMQFPEFRAFKSRAKESQNGETPSSTSMDHDPAREAASPIETIQAAVEESNEAVASELLERIISQPPDFLEKLVLKVLTAMGYGGATGTAERLGRSGDEGLDGVIRQDALGLDRIYIQAKRYAADRTVGRPDIQGFVGALHGAQADRGIFITTARFTKEAHDYANKVAARLVLIDGRSLADLLVQYDIGIQVHETFVIKRIDEDFFEGL